MSRSLYVHFLVSHSLLIIAMETNVCQSLQGIECSCTEKIWDKLSCKQKKLWPLLTYFIIATFLSLACQVHHDMVPACLLTLLPSSTFSKTHTTIVYSNLMLYLPFIFHKTAPSHWHITTTYFPHFAWLRATYLSMLYSGNTL